MNSKNFKGLFCEKDMNSAVTSCNEIFLKNIGSTNYDNVLGRTDYEFPWQKYADIYRKHELDVIAGNDYSIVFPGVNFENRTSLYIHNKAQKKDNSGKIIGIVCHIVEIFDSSILELVFTLNECALNKQQIYRSSRKHDLTLSARQEEVLFYLVRGKTTKNIARILNLSARTIESYLNDIKLKLGCSSKSELIEFAIYSGFLEKIPNQRRIKSLVDALKV